MSLVTIIFCIANFLFKFIYYAWEFHFQVAKKSFGYIKKLSTEFEVWLKKPKEVIHSKTDDQIANIFTKVSVKQFHYSLQSYWQH